MFNALPAAAGAQVHNLLVRWSCSIDVCCMCPPCCVCVGGGAEFTGVWFGAGAGTFQPTFTSNVATVNTSIQNMQCPRNTAGSCSCTNNAGTTGNCLAGTQYTNMDAGIGK